MKKQIIFDADLTMGVTDCDVDDGLALLYVMGAETETPGSADILGLTTSYGNNTLPVVFENAKRLSNDLSFGFPVLKGAPDKDHPLTEAAHFLVEQASAAPGTVSLSVTGSTTNLKGALELDPDVLVKFKELVLMGGITQTLVFNGVIMDELNLSCDPDATLQILEAAAKGASITLMTANNCLPAYFSLDDFKSSIATDAPDGGYLYKTCMPWFDTMQRWYKLDGFVCWDVLCSAYILEPELFVDKKLEVVLDKRLLGAGYLEQGFEGAPTATIKTPRLKDPKAFCARCLELWSLAARRYTTP